MRGSLATALLLIALVASPALAGNTCGSECANNNQCHESDCTRCEQSNSSCVLGYPCGSICQVDTDCNVNDCAFCVNERCSHSNTPVPIPVPVPEHPMPEPPVPVPAPPPMCKDHECQVDSNCTGLGLGCPGCGEDNRCHTSAGFCGRLCENSTQCAGECSDCRDYHCKHPPAPAPPKCHDQHCKDSVDCITEGGRSCSICGSSGRCHTKSSICGARCEHNSQCTGVEGSDCGICLNGKCTGSTCGLSCSASKGVLECTSPGCNYCNKNGQCGQGPGSCGLKCNTIEDCTYPCDTCGGYPSGGYELQCVGSRNVCYHPCRTIEDCTYPCDTCDSAIHRCVGSSNVCGKACNNIEDCTYPCDTCDTGVGKCIGSANVTRII